MFVDTSAWVALAVEGDSSHQAAKAFLKGLDRTRALVTSDYVFDETVTRIRRLAGHHAASRAGSILQSSSIARIVRVEASDFDRAWSIFLKHGDQELSFTDCTTVAVLERLRLRTVFAFDDDFRKLGFEVRPGP